jgi:Tfp pilus assembly protein PilN
MKIENRQHFMVLVAAAAAVLLLGDKLVLPFLTRSWTERATRIVDLRKSVSQGTLLRSRERTIRERWESMRTNTLPNNMSAAENEVLRAFDRWSQESRVSITSIKPQWKQTGEDYATLECRADASGNIQALSRFLFNLEKDPLALKIETVEITARDNDGQQLALVLQVSGLLLSPQEP